MVMVVVVVVGAAGGRGARAVGLLVNETWCQTVCAGRGA